MKEHAMNLRLGLRSFAVPGEQLVRGSLDLCGFIAQPTVSACLTWW